MKILLYLLMIVALIGFGLSVVVHLAGWLNLNLPGYVFGLHIGAIALGLPVGIMALVQVLREENEFWKWNFWYRVLRRAPRRIRTITILIFVYGVISFVVGVMAAGLGRSPAFLPGLGSTFRLFSGHWMIAYWTSFAVAYTFLHEPVEHSAGRRARSRQLSREAKHSTS